MPAAGPPSPVWAQLPPLDPVIQTMDGFGLYADAASGTATAPMTTRHPAAIRQRTTFETAAYQRV
jgi:hypothetical protein